MSYAASENNGATVAWWESVVYKYYLTYTSNLNWNWCNQTNDRGKSWRFDSMQVSWTQSDNEIHSKWQQRWVPASHNRGKAQNSNTGKAMLSPASSTLFGSQCFFFCVLMFFNVFYGNSQYNSLYLERAKLPCRAAEPTLRKKTIQWACKTRAPSQGSRGDISHMGAWQP